MFHARSSNWSLGRIHPCAERTFLIRASTECEAPFRSIALCERSALSSAPLEHGSRLDKNRHRTEDRRWKNSYLHFNLTSLKAWIDFSICSWKMACLEQNVSIHTRRALEKLHTAACKIGPHLRSRRIHLRVVTRNRERPLEMEMLKTESTGVEAQTYLNTSSAENEPQRGTSEFQ